MSTIKILAFLLAIITISGLPVSVDAFRSCEDIWQPGAVYSKYTMKRCDLVWQKITYEALNSYPTSQWK